jgi:signal transduction histidine kinase
MKKRRLINKILPLLMIIFLVIFISTTVIFYYNKKNELENETSIKILSSENILKKGIESETKYIKTIIEMAILQNKQLEKALINKDRISLKHIGEPIFKHLLSENEITHFYFTGVDRVNIIRLHKPDRFGDTINRYTTLKAEKTGKPAFGVELGPLGTLTLRVVYPWYSNDKLIGYIELGKEIDHVINRIKYSLSVEPFILINKNFLLQKSWESGMNMLGFKGNWEMLPNFVVCNVSAANVPDSLIKIFEAFNYKNQNIYILESSKGIKYNLGYFHLIDVSGKDVGIMAIVQDYQKEYIAIIKVFSIAAILCVLFFLITIGIFYKILRRIDKQLEESNNIIETNNILLEKKVKEKTADLLEAKNTFESHYLLQDTLRKILIIATEDLQMYDLLDLILAELIKLPFLSEGKVAIFLVENDPEILVMKMQIGLSEEEDKKCNQVKFGSCLCGKSAKLRKVIFANKVDFDHEILYPDIMPHGHIIIPILTRNKILGVINFYLKEGTERNPHEEELLFSIANTLAGIIERRKVANIVIEKTADLLEAKKTIESHYLLQNMLRTILMIATEDRPLLAILYNILSELITLPFLSIEGKGSIFLIEKDSDILDLQVQIGFSKEIIELCDKVKFGYCLCGKAARDRKIIFANCIDSEHNTMYQGIKPHGHIIIPILSENNLLGVLNFYLQDGTARNLQEEEFLMSIAKTLAGIIERKKIADQLKEYTHQLQKTNEEITNYTFIMSHDLRTPLVNLTGFSYELNESINELKFIIDELITNGRLEDTNKERLNLVISQDIPESLNYISTSTTKINNMMDALLKLARIGNTHLEKELIDVNEIVRITLNLFAYQIDNFDATVTVNKLHDIFADKMSMEQIFGNLIDNAIKYRSLDRSLHIEVFSEKNEAETIYHVKDNGIGIEEHNTKKAFQIFQRIGNHDVPGEGMGLSHVKALVGGNGGNIWCSSQKGVGTTFSFSIPKINRKK